MRGAILVICCLFVGSGVAFAKFPSPELQEIYPAGGQAGTEVTVTVAGLDLEGIKGLEFSNPAIKAERIYHPKSKNWTEPRPKGMTFRVTIPKTVPAGSYDARVACYYGKSSPRIFQVSPAPGAAELDSETEANHSIETARALGLEAVANGKIRQQRADYYKLALKKGQRVLVHCWAVRLGSKLDAKLTLYDPDGKEIFNNNDSIGRDPMLDITAARDGDYYVSVSDQTWLGSQGYVYRLKASGKPYIETVYPAVLQRGKTSQHKVYGRNLPGGKKTGEQVNGGELEVLEVSIQAPDKSDSLPLDGRRPLLGFYEGHNYQLPGSNRFRLALSDDPTVVEVEQDGDIPVNLPSEISGRFDKEQDIDRYRFQAKKGDRLWIEVVADRHYSKSDPFLLIEQLGKDKEGKETVKEIANLDDFRKVKTQGMYDIHTYDDGMELEVPADGDYRIVVGDNFSKQGVLHHYRIHLGHSKPDFQLLTFVEQFHFYGDRRTTVYPGALQLRPEGILPIRVRALRAGGGPFPIALRVEGLPKGVKAHPANVFPGEEEAYIVLEAEKQIESWTGDIRVFGTIDQGKSKVEREAVGATLNWSGTEITYGYTQRLRARRTDTIPLALLGEELPVPITLSQKEVDKVWELKKNGTVTIPLVSTRSDEMKGAVTVMEFGAANKLAFPFRIFINNDKGVDLKVSYRPNTTTNLDLPGEGAFILRGWADINYASYRKGLEPAKALKTKADEKAKQLTLAQGNADKNLKKAQQALVAQTAAHAAEAKQAAAKVAAAKQAVNQLAAAKATASKQAAAKVSAAKQTLEKETAAQKTAVKNLKTKEVEAEAAAAKVVESEQTLANLEVEKAALAKEALAKDTAASQKLVKELAAQRALVKQAGTKVAAAKAALTKASAEKTTAEKAAAAKLVAAQDTLKKETAAQASHQRAAKAKVAEAKQAVKAAEAVLGTAKADLAEITAVQKECQTKFARIEKLSKESKFRAGFFSLPVRYKILPEDKKK